MEREEYSCDEEDWEQYDNLTSVSQNLSTLSYPPCPQGGNYYQHPENYYHHYLGGNISGQYHPDNDQQSTFSVPHPVGTIERSVSRSSKGNSTGHMGLKQPESLKEVSKGPEVS